MVRYEFSEEYLERQEHHMEKRCEQLMTIVLKNDKKEFNDLGMKYMYRYVTGDFTYLQEMENEYDELLLVK